MGVSLIRAVFLDIDGTLLDSNDAHARSWVEALAAHGFDVPYDDIRVRIGKGGDLLLPEVTGLDSESETGKKISATRQKLFRENFLPHLRPFPASRELVQRFKKEGLFIVVASSAESSILDQLLERAGVLDLVDAKTKRGEGDASKPAPDLIEQALELAGVPPEEAVMLGDTPYDIEAARRAGVRTIALTCGGWSPQDLRGASAIHRDPKDLLAQLEREPDSDRRHALDAVT